MSATPSALGVVSGALRYEFRMQIRRVSVWVTLALLTLLVFGIWWAGSSDLLHGFYRRPEGGGAAVWVPPDARSAVLYWVQYLGFFLPLGVGLVLADRLARDSRLHVDEILDTLPGSLGARLTGKFLGSTLATLTPLFLFYLALVAVIVQQTGAVGTLPLALGAFLAVLVPGSLFVAGFSVALPAVIRVPVYQFLFIGYWFWADLMSPKVGIPSIVGTMLNAAGPWAQEGIFHFPWTFLQLHATPAQGYLSIALLTLLGLAAPLALWGSLRWRATSR